MLSTLDFLYLTLAVGFIILVIVGCVALIHVTLIIRDLRKISNTAGNLTENFHNIVATPLFYFGRIAETIGPKIEELIEKKLNKKR